MIRVLFYMPRILCRNSLLLILLWCWGGTEYAFPQESILERRLSVDVENEPPEAFLRSIENKLDFRFAYNADILPEQKINLAVQDEPLGRVLREAFGKAYLFRNNGRMVIILKKESAPDDTRKTILIHGIVTEKGSNTPLASATIYDMTSRRTVLSDLQGAFILDLPVATFGLGLRCSKQGYRDSIVMVPSVSETAIHFRLTPLRRSLEQLEPLQGEEIPFVPTTHAMLVRKLVSPESVLNSRNVRIFDQQPAQLSLIPGIGTNYRLSGAIVNHFSINLISGYSAGVNGFEAGGILNINQFDVRGMQIGGAANLTGGKVRGFQGAGLYNRTGGSVRGVQLCGALNTGPDTVQGVQLAGLMNRNPVFVRGVQLAGLANLCQGEVQGAQIAGLYNYSRRAGFQFGLINVCDTASGTPFGLINIINGGYYALSLSTDAGQHQQLHFVMGTNKMYSMLGLILFNLYPAQKAGLSYGIGRIWYPGRRIQLHTEMSTSVIPASGNLDENTLSLLSLSPQLSVKIVKHHFRLMAGPSYHLLLSGKDNAYSAHFSDHLPENTSFNSVPRETRFLGWPSFRVSLRYLLSE